MEYLYFPLGGSRKGTFRSYLNLVLTMVIGGIWHGANWTYVFWGLLHGLALVVHKLWMKLTKSDKKKPSHVGSIISIILTFAFTSFCWIFFRADSIGAAFSYIARLFTQINPWALTNGAIYKIGLERQEMNILLISVAVMLFVDYMKRRKNIRFENITDKENFWVRGAVIFILLFVVIIFGAYGHSFDAQEFIYFQF
jgi:D-alanyl-lipoteichoic acid acyltransferase DltB (MBOAT superfamily)